MDFAIATDAGRVRQNNEDKAGAAPEIGLFVLCDGMGGLEAGERASAIAVETVIEHTREAAIREAAALDSAKADETLSIAPGGALKYAVEAANEKIFKEARSLGAKVSMGSTIVAMQIEGPRAHLIHVGDSRIYRLRGGQLAQLTEDHSFVAEQVRRGMITAEEASRSQLQNVLTRALGVDSLVEPSSSEELVLDGDTYLLCSDGLTRELTDAQICGILNESNSAQRAADQLVKLANEAGGADNITVVVIRVTTKTGGVRARLGRWISKSEEGN